MASSVSRARSRASIATQLLQYLLSPSSLPKHKTQRGSLGNPKSNGCEGGLAVEAAARCQPSVIRWTKHSSKPTPPEEGGGTTTLRRRGMSRTLVPVENGCAMNLSAKERHAGTSAVICFPRDKRQRARVMGKTTKKKKKNFANNRGRAYVSSMRWRNSTGG